MHDTLISYESNALALLVEENHVGLEVTLSGLRLEERNQTTVEVGGILQGHRLAEGALRVCLDVALHIEDPTGHAIVLHKRAVVAEVDTQIDQRLLVFSGRHSEGVVPDELAHVCRVP